MGLVKWIVNKFVCKSSCKFNDGEFDLDLHKFSLDKFELKYKDMEKIHRILCKRPLKDKPYSKNSYI